MSEQFHYLDTSVVSAWFLEDSDAMQTLWSLDARMNQCAALRTRY